VFKNWKVEEFDSPPNVEYRWAQTSASRSIRHALSGAIDGTQLFVDHEAWGIGVEIVDLPALFMGIPDAEKFWMTADSSRPETISHLRNHGFPAHRARH
jgi:phage terminase large subunit